MVTVIGYLDSKEIYSKQCNKSEVETYVQEALNSWEDADDAGFIEVKIEDENGYMWHP